jgi:hypothetical protein
LRLGKNDKGGRFLTVKWAEPLVIAASLLKRDIFRYDVDNVEPRLDLVYSGHASVCFGSSPGGTEEKSIF